MRGDPVILHFLAETKNGPIKTVVDTSKFQGTNLPEKSIIHRRFTLACLPKTRKLTHELRATGDPRVASCPSCKATMLWKESLSLWEKQKAVEPAGQAGTDACR